MLKKTIKPISLAVGIALAGSLAGVSVAQADSSPFGMTALSSGYMTVASLGEGKCGGDKDKDSEGKCGEGKCGASKEGGEGKCGEGKCGGDMDKDAEGKCGEGKCGEGKCGDDKKA